MDPRSVVGSRFKRQKRKSRTKKDRRGSDTGELMGTRSRVEVNMEKDIEEGNVEVGVRETNRIHCDTIGPT